MSFGVITKLSFNLLWLRRGGIRCFAHSAKQPGFPVRYIPKKHREANHTQNSSSNGPPNAPNNLSSTKNHKDVTRLPLHDEHELNQERFHNREVTENVRFSQEVFEDFQVGNGSTRYQKHEFNQNIGKIDEYERSNTLNYPGVDVEELDDDYLDLSEEEVQKQGRMKSSKTKKDAEKLAIELLAKRAFTAVELRKKLTGRNFPDNIIQAVIQDLQVRGMINDRLYAETYSQSRWTSSTWGPRRIKHALSKKGVSEKDVENAVKLVFKDDKDDDDDSNSNLRLSNATIQQLYIQASKQWKRSKNVPHETRKARVVRWLQYRGFDWGVVSFILKKLESHRPPL